MDKKRIQLLKEMHEKFMILKPDKGQGVVLVTKDDYINSIQHIFSDKRKFKIVKDDPTIKNLTTVQKYFNTLAKRGEITDAIKIQIRPKSAQLGKAYGLPKIHKQCTTIPPFRPIVDTTGTAQYGIAKYLPNLLNPLTLNEYSLKDSFEAVDIIQTMPQELFSEGYSYVFFDVVSLFTNVPLDKTIRIILNRVYEEKVLITTLKKCTMKKLIRDCCSKTTFSFNNILYEQIGGVSMGLPLAPILANIIMTEFEKIVVNELLEKGIIKNYMRYVDDTLMLIKPNDIPIVLEKFNSFNKNL